MVNENAPRSGLSKVLWGILFGCLGMLLLAGLGIGIIGYRAMVAMRHSAAQVNPTTIKQQLAGIPIYPGAQLDLQSTQAVAAGTGIASSMPWALKTKMPTMVAAMYRAAAPPADVTAWYDRQMAALGWSVMRTPPPSYRLGASLPQQHQYTHGPRMLMVQAMSHPSSGNTQLTLMLMTMPPGLTPPAPAAHTQPNLAP